MLSVFSTFIYIRIHEQVGYMTGVMDCVTGVVVGIMSPLATGGCWELTSAISGRRWSHLVRTPTTAESPFVESPCAESPCAESPHESPCESPHLEGKRNSLLFL